MKSNIGYTSEMLLSKTKHISDKYFSPSEKYLSQETKGT